MEGVISVLAKVTGTQINSPEIRASAEGAILTNAILSIPVFRIIRPQNVRDKLFVKSWQLYPCPGQQKLLSYIT
jgi:hypothetical protein